MEFLDIPISEWREKWAGKVCTPDDMARFVDEVGCCTKSALPDYPNFPSQSEVIGKIEPGTTDPWFWKDDLHIEKRLYYTRVFRGQPGFISYKLLPALIATNGATADELIFNGMLTPEAQQIYQAIEVHGPIPKKNLKQMLTPDAKRAADRVLHDLDRQFIITIAGITGRTRGTYGFIWDLVERWVPDMLAEADRIGRTAAMDILREHFTAFGVQPDSPFYTKVLGWTL